jgi:histidinol phosphatase-like PHP family hydrolase
MFSPEAVAKFDYVFTDSMTWTDNAGKRMRLWIKDEVGEIADKQAFMDLLVDRAVGILSREPVDIYVNPTFLPDSIAAEYDQLWTPARMQKVVDAAAKGGVAIEINARYKLPSVAFIKLAKAAGCKFTFGTNNGGREVGKLDYCFEMVKECGLKWQDMWVPKAEGQKPVQVKGLPAT